MPLKFKKEKIFQILTLLFLILLVGFYFGFKQVREIRTDLLLVNSLISKNQKELENIISEVKLLQKVNKDGLSKLETELSVEKERRASIEEQQLKDKILSQKQLLSLEEQIIESKKNILIGVVNQWEPYVVSLECRFYSASTGSLLFQSSGSGLLTEWGDASATVLTNKHIVTAISLDRSDLANECTITFPQKDISIISKKVKVLVEDYDWGLVTIDFPNDYIKSLLQNSPSLCSKTPTLGDSVAILGYPSIGDQKNVTVTEGIIAGFDSDYFITSAKVEKGNSGGAAVSLENNCYLGTPTFSRTGEIESLARILDVRVLNQ